ncbi:MAG TPA: molybdopterin-synthase adenylyltransferase MoeB [Candidatus Thermoplasmatota archaeon]|nr:molybdopterin-synthase adenylyltransferase MoeB [Candidatus Thermoplasmatota archaeon]
MAVTVRIPTPLRRFTDGAAKVTVSGANVGAALEALLRAHEGLRPHLLDDRGKLRNYVNLYVNDQDIREVKGDATPLRDGDVLMIVPAIAGGAPLAMAPAPPDLAQDELIRYSRHLLIPEVGVEGQKRLKASRVLIIGLGGLGSPIAQYLAAAGVGRLGLVEFDRVDLSNLQRQILYGTKDIGQPKGERARDRIRSSNPNVDVVLHAEKLTSQNALELFRDYDVIVDGTDNFPTRYLVNDACVLTKKPNVYGSIFRFEGQLSVFWAEKGPCYRCLYESPPPPGLVPSCAEGGVLGVLPGIIGTLQANEVLKLLLGIGEPMVGRLLLFDALDMNFVTVKLAKNPKCVVCGPTPTITRLIDYEDFCGLQPVMKSDSQNLLATDVKRKLDRKEEFVLLDVREPFEYEIAHIPGSTLVPMSELQRREAELETHKAKEIVVFCHHGNRSQTVASYLRKKGYPAVKNLVGGINAWSEDVDPSIPQY